MTTWEASPRVTKRRFLEHWAAIALATGATPLAAACGVAGSTGSEGTGAPAAAPVRLLYRAQRAPDDRLGNGVKAALDDYVAKYPGKITIEVGEGGQPLGLDKIKTAIAANTPPDLYGGLYQSPAVELF